MRFDSLVINPGRLQILATLAAQGTQEFVHLRKATQLTDGNLATHARRLSEGGLIAIHKEFREGKPVTRFTLNEQGRAALESHARDLLLAIGGGAFATSESPEAKGPMAKFASHQAEDDWVD